MINPSTVYYVMNLSVGHWLSVNHALEERENLSWYGCLIYWHLFIKYRDCKLPSPVSHRPHLHSFCYIYLKTFRYRSRWEGLENNRNKNISMYTTGTLQICLLSWILWLRNKFAHLSDASWRQWARTWETDTQLILISYCKLIIIKNMMQNCKRFHCLTHSRFFLSIKAPVVWWLS